MQDDADEATACAPEMGAALPFTCRIAERNPREQRKLEQIMDGARAVFREEGFSGASVDEITRRAGISKATLYRYFPDKTALFTALVRSECHEQAERMLTFEPDGRPLDALLRQVAEGYIGFILSPFAQGIYRIAVAESERQPSIGMAFFESGPDAARRRLAPVLAAAAERGEIAVADADLAALQFFELCKADLFYKSLFCRAAQACAGVIEARAAQVTEIFLRAYAPAPQAAEG